MGNEAASKMPERLLGAAFFCAGRSAKLSSINLLMPRIFVRIMNMIRTNVLAGRCMKMFEERRTDRSGHRGALFVPGDTCEFSMLWGMVKAEIRQRLYSYLGN